MQKVYYLNLTNGLEKIKEYPAAHFIRIQSSHCESKAYDRMFAYLDSDFLMNLAWGRECIVVDGNKKADTKALRVGVKTIEYVLNRLWFGRTILIDRISPKYLSGVYSSLSPHTKTKLRYYKKFLLTEKIHLSSLGFETENDGVYEYFRQILKENFDA